MIDKLIEKIKATDNPSVIGLDTDIDYLPPEMKEKCTDCESASKYIYEFNHNIIDKICDIVPAVKVQVAYYEFLGFYGYEAFAKTLKYAKSKGLFTIADVKRNDIGSTAKAYSKAFFGGTGLKNSPNPVFESDFITVNGYLGIDGIQPFLTPDKGIFILVKTSNPSSADLQDLVLKDGRTVYSAMGKLVSEWGKDSIGKYGYSNVGAVVGATHPKEAEILRREMPSVFFLVPGYGAQGGSAKDLKPCFDENKSGAIVNSSRGIICAYKSPKYQGLSYADASLRACEDMQRDIINGLK